MILTRKGLRLSTLALAALMALAAASWLATPARSGAEMGSMNNCPPAGRWSIAVWEGQGGTATSDALATCGGGAVDAAYSLDPQTGAWWRWFAGKPEMSNLPPLDDGQGVLALGSTTGPVATPPPSTSATPTVSPTGTPMATATPEGTPSLNVELSQQCFQAWTAAEALENIIYAGEQTGMSTTYLQTLLAEQDDFIQQNCLSPSVAPVPDPNSDSICEDVAAMRLDAAAFIALSESEGVPQVYLSQQLEQLGTFYDSYCR